MSSEGVWSRSIISTHVLFIIPFVFTGALVPTSVNPHSSSGFEVKPRLVFCTAAGAIGIVASTDKDSGKLLTEVERNLREVIKPIGDIPYEEWVYCQYTFRLKRTSFDFELVLSLIFSIDIELSGPIIVNRLRQVSSMETSCNASLLFQSSKGIEFFKVQTVRMRKFLVQLKKSLDWLKS